MPGAGLHRARVHSQPARENVKPRELHPEGLEFLALGCHAPALRMVTEVTSGIHYNYIHCTLCNIPCYITAYIMKLEHVVALHAPSWSSRIHVTQQGRLWHRVQQASRSQNIKWLKA